MMLEMDLVCFKHIKIWIFLDNLPHGIMDKATNPKQRALPFSIIDNEFFK
jgi:hypothetical protein